MQENENKSSPNVHLDRKTPRKGSPSPKNKPGALVSGLILLFLALLGAMIWSQKQLGELKKEISVNTKRISEIQAQWANMKQQFQLQREIKPVQQKSIEYRVVRAEHPQTQDILYWLNLAHQSLRLQKNLNLAIQALHLAHSQVNMLKGENAAPLKTAIEKKIQVLEAIDVPQQDKLMDQLTHLAAETGELSVKKRFFQPGIEFQNVTPQQNVSGYLKYWERFKQTLTSLLNKAVVVRREPLDDPEYFVPTKTYLVDQIQLLLLRAQWAVFQREGSAYQRDLNQTIQWLKRYFVQDAKNQEIQMQLEKLKVIVIEPVLPDLSHLLNRATSLKQTEPLPAERKPAESSNKEAPNPIHEQRILSS